MAVPAIRTEKLARSYGPFTALHPLDLELQPGEVLGYLLWQWSRSNGAT